jgi:hypothetical protein
LTPDHDEVLADVFVDRVASVMNAPATPGRHRQDIPFWSRPGRLIGAIVLALACLGGASRLSFGHPQVSHALPVPAKMFPVPAPGKLPAPPPAPKAPSLPLAPKPGP